MVVFGAPEMFNVLLMHLNVRSLKTNLDKLEALILGLSSPPSVLCLTENNDPKCFLFHSQYLMKCRPSRGGGVMIQVRKDLSIIKETETSFEEALFAEISKAGNRFKVLTVYNKPRNNKKLFVELLDTFLEKHTSVETPFVVCGDLNIDILKDNQLNKDYKNVIQSNGFELSETSPTRVTISSMSCIDHIIQQKCISPQVFVLEYQSFSDHYPLTIKWKITRKCS